MTKYFRNYYWKEGRPQGLGLTTREAEGCAFKIVSDPYHKWISIEKYQDGQFDSIVYDNQLLNFRHLNPANQTAWEKTLVSESSVEAVAHIRNQDDRLVYIETYLFSRDLCRECQIRSPHGLLLATHYMLYEDFGNSFNGVVLFDANGHPVMYKKYQWNGDKREFTDLLEEIWNMENQDLAWLKSLCSQKMSS